MYNRGSMPIDGLYRTRALWELRCGYTAFRVFDHRAMYIDIPNTIAFGSAIPPIAPRVKCRLKPKDPRMVKSYLEQYK